MPRMLLTGGRQRPLKALDEGHQHSYEAALVFGLDTTSGELAPLMEYTSAPDICPPHVSQVFKAASWDGDRLLLCTEVEAIEVDPERFSVLHRTSHPWMNDVHHVARIDGRLHVVSTGLDCLLVFGPDGELERAEPVIDEDLWARFDRETDYRPLSTKPHPIHPNYVFRTEDGVWITRLGRFDAICIDDRSKRMVLGEQRVHDGVVHGDHVWFTSVTGDVIQVDRRTHQVVERYDLNAIDATAEPLGWCRGILLEDGVAYVGFSRIRQTKLRENLSWVRHGFKRQRILPTRIAAYDLARREKLDEWILEDVGMDAVFSMLPWDR